MRSLSCESRKKPFRLYICAARLGGPGDWAALSAAVNKRLLAPGHHWSPRLRLLVSGRALTWNGKEHVRARWGWGAAAAAGTALS